jgi:hypothetical protein
LLHADHLDPLPITAIDRLSAFFIRRSPYLRGCIALLIVSALSILAYSISFNLSRVGDNLNQTKIKVLILE